MTLTLGTGPFAPQADGSFNFQREGPAHVLFWQPWPRRMRAVIDGVTVIDTEGGSMLHETGILPVFYAPEADVAPGVLEPSDTHTFCPFKGTASYHSVHVGDRILPDAVWYYPEPIEGCPPIAGYVALKYDLADRWYEEDEPIYAHPKDAYHRVDVRSSSRHVVVRVEGEVVAESTRPKLLFETGLPVRYYLPAADVRLDRLQRSDTVSECPYKGDGQHWSLTSNGSGDTDDIAWSLPHPLPEAFACLDHYCFYPDKVETVVDGATVTA